MGSVNILRKALEMFADGDQEGAWEIARVDEALNEDVTKQQWMHFADNSEVVERIRANRRKVVERLNKRHA